MLISILQIIISIVLIVLILFQERSSGLSGMFGGGGGEEGVYQKRRGLEKLIFRATVILVILFAGLSLLNLLF
ncbi:MAG TPA: preprotein translocase subunit SecG [Candidatus Wolfebacteria bacterium]|nr:preprotein translocase subunit SecG [Candidatus Wolfebacteria bacterium]